MKKTFIVVLLIVWAAAKTQAQLLPTFGGERAGLSALSFLKNDMSPRSVAMGGASVALNGDAYAMWQNPAGMTDLGTMAFSMSNYFLGAGINQSWLSGIIPTGDKVGAFGISFDMLNSGALEERTEFRPGGTGRYVYATNMAIGLGYSRKLSEQFEAAISIKYVYEQLSEYFNHTAAVDLAFLYKTDYKHLQFAAMVQNFSGSSSLSGTYIASGFNRVAQGNLEDNTLPNVFSLGVSMIPYEEGSHILLTSIQLNHPNDNAENFRIGLEYTYLKLLSVRAGYKINVAGQKIPTFGFGIRHRMGGHPMYFDYAVNPTSHLGFQHLVGIRVELNKDL